MPQTANQAPGSSAFAVEIQGVTKRFTRGTEQVTALEQLSFLALAGKVTGLVGPDAAGKTTLLRLCTGLLTPDESQARLLGYDVATQASAIQSRIGYMPQRFGLYEDLTVMENLNLYMPTCITCPVNGDANVLMICWSLPVSAGLRDGWPVPCLAA